MTKDSDGLFMIFLYYCRTKNQIDKSIHTNSLGRIMRTSDDATGSWRRIRHKNPKLFFISEIVLYPMLVVMLVIVLEEGKSLQGPRKAGTVGFPSQ